MRIPRGAGRGKNAAWRPKDPLNWDWGGRGALCMAPHTLLEALAPLSPGFSFCVRNDPNVPRIVSMDPRPLKGISPPGLGAAGPRPPTGVASYRANRSADRHRARHGDWLRSSGQSGRRFHHWPRRYRRAIVQKVGNPEAEPVSGACPRCIFTVISARPISAAICVVLRRTSWSPERLRPPCKRQGPV